MYEVRTSDYEIKQFPSLIKAKKYLVKEGKKQYSAIYNDKNKIIAWRSPSGLR